MNVVLLFSFFVNILVFKFLACGEKGIRTLETLSAFTHFPGVRLRPLGHLSQLKFERVKLQKKYEYRPNSFYFFQTKLFLLLQCHLFFIH